MKVACLQIGPQLGQVDDNIRQADDILSSSNPSDLDVLVLPELAFTGYNFPNLAAIQPFLEPTTSGRSTVWAIATARRLNCHVIVGYPEVSSEKDIDGKAINYNATVTVNPEGAVLANYRKSFLYYTDECWAAEGSGFYCGSLGKLGTVGLGICMDINPYQFTSPWDAYEFAAHVIAGGAETIILSTAWLTHKPPELLRSSPELPDVDTLAYWIQRFSPLIKASETQEKEVFVVFANRFGEEINELKTIHAKNGQVVELGDAVNYAGTSCVMRFGKGQVNIMDMLGQAHEGLLVVDTSDLPKYQLATRPTESQSNSGADETI